MMKNTMRETAATRFMMNTAEAKLNLRRHIKVISSADVNTQSYVSSAAQTAISNAVPRAEEVRTHARQNSAVLQIAENKVLSP